MTWADLDAARKAQGLSLAEASRRAGYSSGAMAKAVRGETVGSDGLFRALCRALDVGQEERDIRPEDVRTWQDLDRLRKAQGLSREELSLRAGHGRCLFSHVMHGRSDRSKALWRGFCAVLGVDAAEPDAIEEERFLAARRAAYLAARRRQYQAKAMGSPPASTLGEPPVPPRSTFARGKRYEIRGSVRGSRDASSTSETFRPLVATYLRKEGIHHVFRGPGGWLTTWTDAQLVGKRVTSA